MRLKKFIFKVFLMLAVPAIILQPGYYSVAHAVDIFSKQPKNINVPPLDQQQDTPNLAQDNASQNTSPILTPDQNTLENRKL